MCAGVERSWILTLAIAAAMIPVAAAQEISDIYVTPIAKAPFSGIVYVQRTIIGRGGSVTNLTATREIGRDHVGRTFEVRRSSVFTSQTTEPAIIRIDLYDPQTSVFTVLFPSNRTFVQRIVDDLPSPLPAFKHASPAENSSTDYMKDGDLGTREVSGVAARGFRKLKITPADFSGTGKEIVISDEYWYSDDLRIYVMIKHDDPRTGNITMTLGEISRTEPNPVLFEIPSGYKPKN